LDSRDIRTQTTKDTVRRQAKQTKDAIVLQGHQDTNNEGHHETSGHENEGRHWISGHQDTNTQGHDEASGHEDEGRHWTSGRSGHEPPRTPSDVRPQKRRRPLDLRAIRTQTDKDTVRHQATKTKDRDFRDIRTQTTKDTMRRQDTNTKDAIGPQRHQDTNNEGHNETSGHEYEGRHWTPGTSGHKQPRTP